MTASSQLGNGNGVERWGSLARGYAAIDNRSAESVLDGIAMTACTINIHIYPSPFEHESRILRETKSVADSGLVGKVYMVGIWEPGLAEFETVDQKREVWRVPLRTGKLPAHVISRVIKILEWQIRIFLRYRDESVLVFNCHNLASLPIGVIFKLLYRVKLVYDTHELETERSGWPYLLRVAAKQLERVLVRFVDVLFVVSDSIGTWYRHNCRIEEIHVIKNVPYNVINHGKSEASVSRALLREPFNVRDDEILFIYQGVMDEGRGIELLLKVFSEVDRNKHIVFMGFAGHSNLESVIKEYEHKYNNVHFHESVSPQEVLSYTRCADVGFHLFEDTCLSHRFAVGNKMYEYILSGVPFIASDYPDVGKIIDEYDCGWKVSTDVVAIMDVVRRISKGAIEQKKRNVARCRNAFGWHLEEEKMLAVYRRMLAISGDPAARRQ